MRDERLENLRQQLSWNAATGIGDFNVEARIVSLDAKSQNPLVAFCHRFAGVANQIAEHAQEAVSMSTPRPPERQVP